MITVACGAGLAADPAADAAADPATAGTLSAASAAVKAPAPTATAVLRPRRIAPPFLYAKTDQI
jgi:hypothetical protein